MKKLLSFLLSLLICITPLKLVYGQSADWATSVTPTLQSGIGFDFSGFDNGSQLPVRMSKVVSGGSVSFDGRMIVESSGNTRLCESYVQAGEFSLRKPAFLVEFEMSALKETSGNLRIYLRDGSAWHSGCEIPLVIFEENSVTFANHKTEDAPSDKRLYKIIVRPEAGTLLFYSDNTFVCEVKSDMSSFDFSKFYLRFHTHTPAGASGTNKMEIHRVFLGEDISKEDYVSAVNKGLYREGYKVDFPQNGVNTLKLSLTNNSDDEKNLYFVYKTNSADAVYEPFSIMPQSSSDYEFEMDITGFEKGKKISMHFTDENRTPLTSEIEFVSNGYTPPIPSQLLSDASDLAGVHPRIAADAEAFEKAAMLYGSDGDVANAYQSGYDKTLADKLISKAPNGGYYHVPCPYDDSDDLRLLAADTVLRYCKALAAEYILTGREEYKTRLWLELRNAASYPDWNPKHFLDTASLCYAFALSYDWLYDSWSDEQQKTIREALINKGLSCYRDAYKGKTDGYAEWRYRRNNWNVVCNGGAIIGALALIDNEDCSDMCSEIIYGAMKSLNTALESFSPDGAWYEGSGYWEYTMQYLTVVMSSLKICTGTFYGIDLADGIAKTAMFPVYTTGEYEINLNDNGAEKYVSIPENFYLAKVFDTPSAAAYRMKQLRENDKEAEILDLLWYEDEYENAQIAGGIHRMTILGGADIAVMRTDNAFSAIHWGYNNISHGHLDCGTLFYDSDGERWLEDMGADDYNLYDYFNVSDGAYPKGRWAYYRTRGEAHNTMVIGTDSSMPDQNPDSGGKLFKAAEWDSGSFAVVDMSECYPSAEKVQRGVRFDYDTGRLTVADEVTMSADYAGCPIYHIFHTKADAVVADNGKTLYLIRESDGKLKYITMKILSEGDEVFEICEDKPFNASPNPDLWNENISLSKTQAKNDGKKIIIRQSAHSGLNSLQVALIPQGDGHNPYNALSELEFLSKW